MEHRDKLLNEIGELGTLLLSEGTLDSTLRRVAELAVKVIPACDGAGVSLVDDGRVTTRGAANELTERVDSCQYELDEGPCLDAIRDGRLLKIEVMREETRWPRYTPRAVEAGVVSSLSVPLMVRDDTVGALNLYSLQDTFGAEDERMAFVFAAQSAVALANAETYQKARDVAGQLSQALESRDVIGQAKGILMEREHCGPKEAFDILVRTSQRLNRKLRDVAQQVIDSAAGRPEG